MFKKCVWEDVSAGLQGHHVYGEWLASLHKIFVDAACSSSELSTAPRDVFAFPLGKWEPSSNQKTSFHFLVLFTPFPSWSHSNALSACYFAFPSVSKLVWSQFLIPRVFPKILQLIGCNCEVIVLLGLTIYNIYLGMPWSLPILQGTEKQICSFSMIHEMLRFTVDHVTADLSTNTSFQIQNGFFQAW